MLELLVVMAMIILLATAALPSFTGLKNNGDQKAAADQVRGLIADARGLAMSTGTPYRLAITGTGDKVRLAPDDANFTTATVVDTPSASAVAIEIKLHNATVMAASDSESTQISADSDNWTTLGTFLPNGTCRETMTVIEIHENGFPALKILLRGVTGTARILQPDAVVNSSNSNSAASGGPPP
jgi:type II secretory pathway pseudopilin PulG